MILYLYVYHLGSIKNKFQSIMNHQEPSSINKKEDRNKIHEV